MPSTPTEQQQRIIQKLALYLPSEPTKQLVRETSLLLLVGISGAGKDTLMKQLLKIGNFTAIVSHTTRAPRMEHGVMEKEGVNYHFISVDEAERMIDEHAFVEAKIYSGNVYGTSVAEVRKARDSHKIAVTDIEVQGVAEYKAVAPEAQAVFILPPDYETWQKRLKSRYGNAFDQADYHKRMETAFKELSFALVSDYFAYVISGDIDESVAKLCEISQLKRIDATEQAHGKAIAEELLKDTQAYLQNQHR